jgi:5-methyltetrahydropteroyltriglutamate--homocysteine methyltransferase
MATAINLGFARIGKNRELKKAVEAYWAGNSSRENLLGAAREIRRQNWAWQDAAGLDQLPAGDFSLYDHVLDTAFMFDLIPDRFRELDLSDDLDLYFAMARGHAANKSIQALEMTKWFDTNYHYLVPEFTGREKARLARATQVESYREAKALGYTARPVILGPVSLLLLGKAKEPGLVSLNLLDRLLPAYEDLLRELAGAGAEWIQIDEPVLALDLGEAAQEALSKSVGRLGRVSSQLKILLVAYFGSLRENLDRALGLPIHALHLDLVRGPEQLEQAIRNAPRSLTLSLGLVDGRNIWKTDLARALETAEQAAAKLSAERVMVSPSCSLLHVPVDLSPETHLPSEVKDWLAFGLQKLDEVVVLKRALNEGRNAIRAELDANAESWKKRRISNLTLNHEVRKRMAAVGQNELNRQSPFPERRREQQAVLKLPPLPTTTIGSFPQTGELRQQRARMRKGEIRPEEYDGYLRKEVAHAIGEQEKLGLDVLVHGEAERNDMVEYFGELIDGFAFTDNGWVQSYGSRCVKPPIIYGDIARRGPMTVDWWRYAQSLTSHPMKGMLTGPVTILQWSFVRDDQPRRNTCLQLALAIREETLDLEAAGCRVIQIDEPALREGLPLRKSDAAEYLQWAVDSFRLASAGVKNSTQIHTHMCYAEFNDIVDAISAMDADVISIESTRSQMELLNAFVGDRYRNEIGPGVYDIHSPRVPSAEEMTALLEKALRVIPAERLWVNPDCGLKTRQWKEVSAALRNMVAAASTVREKLTAASATTNR